MCQDCEDTDTVLPSVLSFQSRLHNPKVNYLFYEYFYKAVIGEARWKRNMEEKKPCGTSISEAFTHALLENNYFSWLLDYKMRSGQDCAIITECDDDKKDDQGRAVKKELFMGAVTAIQVEVPKERGDPYKIYDKHSPQARFDAAKTKTEHLHKKLREKARSPDETHKKMFDEIAKTHSAYKNDVLADATNTRVDVMKKKRKLLKELKVYTGTNEDDEENAGRRKKRKTKGWSDDGKRFLVNMTKAIRDELKDNSHKAWEEMYATMCKHVQAEHKRSLDRVPVEDRYEVNAELMCEV